MFFVKLDENLKNENPDQNTKGLKSFVEVIQDPKKVYFEHFDTVMR